MVLRTVFVRLIACMPHQRSSIQCKKTQQSNAGTIRIRVAACWRKWMLWREKGAVCHKHMKGINRWCLIGNEARQLQPQEGWTLRRSR